MMKQMGVVGFLVHVGIWLLAVAGVFAVWSFADDYRRILVAPGISAAVNGLAALACGAIILIDIRKNGSLMVEFLDDCLDAALCGIEEIQENCKRRHRQQLRRKARKLGQIGLRRELHTNLPEDFFRTEE